MLEVARQLETLPTAPVACEAIRHNSAVILCPSMDAAVEASNQLAPEHLAIYDAEPASEDPARGQRLPGTEQPGGRGRLRDRSESRAAYIGRGSSSRRTIVGRFREGDLGAGADAGCLAAACAGHHHAGARGRPGSARAIGGGAPWLSKRIDLPPGVLQPREAVLNMAPYSPPTGGRGGKLRLDFNENTVGALPR